MEAGDSLGCVQTALKPPVYSVAQWTLLYELCSCVASLQIGSSSWLVPVYNNNNNNNIYLLQLGCYPVAVVILHVYRIWNWLVINLSREGYMRSM